LDNLFTTYSSFLILPLRFNSVEQILNQLEKQPGWEKFKEYRQLLKCWDKTVNQQTSKHTRPLYITRQVLWVATDSAAPFPLKDIRFSSSGWHQKTSQPENSTNLFKISSQDKFTVADSNSIFTAAETEDNQEQSSPNLAKSAAQRWLKTLKQENSSLLPCPGCKALTPRAEIKRWDLCHHCIAQKWSQEYRPPTFPELK